MNDGQTNTAKQRTAGGTVLLATRRTAGGIVLSLELGLCTQTHAQNDTSTQRTAGGTVLPATRQHGEQLAELLVELALGTQTDT